MSQAELQDPEELRQFITALQNYNDELSNTMASLSGHWTELGGVWRDGVYAKFSAEWETTVRLVENYLREAPNYVGHLQTKLRQVTKYSGS